ncbi:hypothetical protein HYX16_06550 [Candidatus Woesearchaeota archaeon]|nr:hypothetical protein [Candidatus Woesearchaeota archaeon]
MRDKSHIEQVERWARYVKDNPDKWKSKVKPLIDSQILMSRRFFENLAKIDGGKQKIEKLRNLRI